jgi:hypothetical protein
MSVIDSRDTLDFAHQHAVRLKADAASDRNRRASWKRRSLVRWLRRHACRCHIDTAPAAHHSA